MGEKGKATIFEAHIGDIAEYTKNGSPVLAQLHFSLLTWPIQNAEVEWV
jgi:hypothetical protein